MDCSFGIKNRENESARCAVWTWQNNGVLWAKEESWWSQGTESVVVFYFFPYARNKFLSMWHLFGIWGSVNVGGEWEVFPAFSGNTVYLFCNMLRFTEQQFLPDILWEPKDARPIKQGWFEPALLNYFPVWPGKTCPGMPAEQFLRNGCGWLIAVYWLAGDDTRGVDWAVWHVDFHTEIGLQPVVIKGHGVINALDTSGLPTLDTHGRKTGVTWNNSSLEPLNQRAPRDLQPLINPSAPLLAYYSGMEDSSSVDNWKAEVTELHFYAKYTCLKTRIKAPYVHRLRNNLRILLL